MDLKSLPWKTVCCSDHETATVVVDDVTVSVQRSGDSFSVLVVKSGVIDTRLTGVTKDVATSAIADF